jgi:chromate reductase
VMAFCNSPLMNSVEAYIHFKPGSRHARRQVTEPSGRSSSRAT